MSVNPSFVGYLSRHGAGHRRVEKERGAFGLGERPDPRGGGSGRAPGARRDPPAVR